jgi:predicted ribosome quality control (RQC) complex YloA/Tae2 family protein
MHIHYFILRKIADQLDRELAGGILAETITQDKDQVMIGLGTPDQDLWLRVSCGSPLPFIWPMRQFHKARRNTLMLFTQLNGLKIKRIYAIPYERVLMIDLDRQFQIALKMHGLLSNVLVLQHGRVVDRFRQHSDADLAFVPTAGTYFPENIDAPTLASLPVAEHLRAISPVFEKHFAAFVEGEMARGLDFAGAFRSCMAAVDDDRYYILRRKDRIQLLLFQPQQAEAVEIEGVERALQVFFKTWHQYQNYARVYEDVRKPLEKHLQRIQGQIDSFYLSIDTIAHERPPEEIGHILMANLHQLSQGQKEVELVDFYHDQPIAIKLKPELNPQQNAESYYQKQKKHRSRMKHLEEQIIRLEQELAVFGPAREAFAKFPMPIALQLGSDGIDYAMLKGMNAFGAEYLPLIQSGKADSDRPKHGFLEFKKDGYTILCGKNAKQNEALTFAYSKKDDLWMHARDTPGSHVIIRNPTAGPIPANVLEFAASVAALNSKRKRENLVPVQYCERKYVRKLKGGAVGQVIVEREKVVMVEPLEKSST